MSEALVKQHAPHGWAIASAMATIQRVPRAATQQIMDCPCGWYGWIDRSALSPGSGVSDE